MTTRQKQIIRNNRIIVLTIVWSLLFILPVVGALTTHSWIMAIFPAGLCFPSLCIISYKYAKDWNLQSLEPQDTNLFWRN